MEQSIINILNELYQKEKHISSKDRNESPEFTPFRFMYTNEDGISAILAFLLDPNESHSQGDFFLKKFFKLLDLRDALLIECDSVFVTLNKHTYLGRRHDIFLEGYKNGVVQWVVSIESKLRGAYEQENQISHYIDDLKRYHKENYFMVFLPVIEKKPISINEMDWDNEVKNSRAVIITPTFLVKWLQDCHTENRKIDQFIEYFKEFLNQEFIMSNENKSQFIPNLLEKLDDEERRNAFEVVMKAIKNRGEIYRVLAEKLEQSLIDKLSSSKYQDWKLITINKNGDTILPIYISNDKYSFDICFESNGKTYCGLRFKDSVNEELKERDNEVLNKIIIKNAHKTSKYPIWFYTTNHIIDEWNEKSWTQLASDVDSVTKDFWAPIEDLLRNLNEVEGGK